MDTWVRRSYDGVGLTQSPPGPYLDGLRARYTARSGSVLLCIDVSGSMSEERLRSAVAGGARFLQEATDGRYDSGLVLWDDRVVTYVPPEPSGTAALTALRAAVTGGGTDVVPCLELATRVFRPIEGDRALCLFSDGMFGNRERAVALARRLCAMGVRIIVRGLGPAAAAALADLTCPGCPDGQRVIADETAIDSGIASMAAGLTGVTVQAPAGRHR